MSEKKFYIVQQTCSVVYGTEVEASSAEEAAKLAHESWDWETLGDPSPVSGMRVYDEEFNCLLDEDA